MTWRPSEVGVVDIVGGVDETRQEKSSGILCERASALCATALLGALPFLDIGLACEA